MHIIGIGVDIIEIERIREACQKRVSFAARVFTRAEYAYAAGKSSPWQHLAVRFAAKEAVAKSLGGSFSWHDVEVFNSASGVPLISLSGRALQAAAALGVSEVKVSLSHSRGYALAQAMAIGGSTDEGDHR